MSAPTFRDLVELYAITEDTPLVPQPKELKIPLKPHQRALVARCTELESGRSIYPDGFGDCYTNVQIQTEQGIICDKPGAGKSYTVLGLIAHQPVVVKKTRTVIRAVSQHLLALGEGKCSLPYRDLNVIVVPDNLLAQWREYLAKLNSRVYIVGSSGFIDADAKVALVQAKHYKLCAQQLQTVCINRIFYDEADSINLPNCLQIEAGFYWFVTASVEALFGKIHNNGFIRGSFCGMRQNEYTAQVFLKNRDNYVDASFQLEEPVVTVLPCFAPRFRQLFTGIVSTEIVAMLDAGDHKGIVSALGIETQEDTTHIVEHLTTSLRNQLHNKQVDYEARQRTVYATAAYKEKVLKELNEDIVKLQTNIAGIESRVKDDQLCYICYDDIVKRTVTKCCTNSSCFECITQYIMRKQGRCNCPMCRAELTVKDVIVVESATIEQEEPTVTPPVLPTKVERLKEWCREHYTSTTKLLIFSEFEGSFEAVSAVLTEQHIRFETTNQARAVSHYLDGSLPVLILNSRKYGNGLNLQMTTDIILYHRMTPELEAQVIGRAQRPGRTSPLRVWKLYHEGE